jgi:cell division protein FtsL
MSMQDTDTRRIKRPGRYTELRTEADSAAGGNSYAVFWLAAIILAMVALSYVYMRKSTQQMTKQINQMHSELALMSQEAKNLQMEQENLRRGNYILTAVKRHNLGLRQPLHKQVRRIQPAVAAAAGTRRDGRLVAKR